MSEPAYTYNSVVENVVDGDTVDVQMDLGMRVYTRTRLRVAWIDTPETYTAEGKAAKARAVELLPRGSLVTVSTYKPDKYGRALADIRLADGRDYGTILIHEGHAVPYYGGTR